MQHFLLRLARAIGGVAFIFALSARPVFAQGVPNNGCGSTNITEYVAPRNPGGLIGSSSVGEGYEYYGNVANRVEWVNGDTFKQISNDIHFLYRVGSSHINFLQDTIWNPFTCDGSQLDAMYRVYQNDNGRTPQLGGAAADAGNWGARFLANTMSCGQTVSSTSYIRGYSTPADIETNPLRDISANECRVGNYTLTTVTNTYQLIFQGEATCNDKNTGVNGEPLEVIAITITGGAGAGEVDMYCKGYGLCAFYQSLDFSDPDNNPANWTAETDVCHLKGGKTRAPYYLYPINGLNKSTNLGSISDIQQSLVNQGYEVQCTTPQFYINAKTGGDLERFFDLGGSTVVSLDPKLIYNFDQARYPLFRKGTGGSSTSNSSSGSSNDTGGKGVLESLENYFGFIDTDTTDVESDEIRLEQAIKSAPIYSLLSLEDQCIQKIKLLETIQVMCEKLDDPSKCALYKSIPNTNFNTEPTGSASLLGTFNERGYSCAQLFGGGPERLQVIGADVIALKEAITNLPLYLDKAYRLAFLVITSELWPQRNQLDFFTFLRARDKSGEKHEVKVLAFRIPDIGTNKDYNSDIFYTDPLQLTRDTLLNKELQDQAKEKLLLERQSDIEGLAAGDYTFCGDGCPVLCQDPECSSLQDPLAISLARLVNHEGKVCSVDADDLKAEDVFTITDKVGLQQTDGNVLKPDQYRQVADLFKSNEANGVASSPSQARFNFFSNIRIQRNVTGNGSPAVRAYLVYPVGAELSSVEDTLLGLIMTPEQVTAYKSNPDLLKYFPMENTEPKLDSSKPQVGFRDPACIPTLDGKGCQKNVEAYVEAEPKDQNFVRVLGGVLGSTIRTLQQSLYSLGSLQYKFITSCKTTEDYLLGRCKPADDDTNDPSSPVAPTEGMYCIDWEVDASRADEIKAAARNALTTQYPYSFVQPGSPGRSGNQYQDERYQELLGQNHVRWDGSVIRPEEINRMENFYGGGRALLWTVSDQCEGQVCFDYIMNRCAAAGFNPALCVAMNFSESGGSNQIRFGGSYDFGCLLAETNNVQSGLNCLINRFFVHQSGKDYNGMFVRFAGYGLDSPSYQKIRQYYTELTAGLSDPGISDGACQ